jgi:hypothetical protein
MNMKISIPKNPNFIEKSLEIYRGFWQERLQGDIDHDCKFLGDANDIAALGYCVYELGFPEEDYLHTSVVWGNVIQKHTNLIWGEDPSGNLLLYSDQFPRFLLYPHARINEIMHSTSPIQFDQFDLITEKVFLEMIMSGYYPEDLSNFIDLVKKVRQGSDNNMVTEIEYVINKIKVLF